ncbi:MAG TPA: MBL fold metallo-hydrolase [Polyangiaceae bacterium]|nr:MBL fold metallo-hydrolase [Polyangiaceae bacterium]
MTLQCHVERPSGGVPAARPLEALESTRVADSIYAERDGDEGDMVLVTSDGVVVVDPLNPDFALRLAKELKRLAPGAKLAAIVYSHSHQDHAGGAQVLLDIFGGNVPIIAGRRTAEHLKERGVPTVVPPSEVVQAPWSRRFGSLTLELLDVGPNHTDDMLVGWVPEAKTAYLVDFVNNRTCGYRDLPGASLPGYWESIDRVLAWPIEHVVFGHGAPAGRDAVAENAAYWRAIRARVRRAIDAGQSEDDAARSIELPAYRDWGMFAEWFPSNVRAAYRFERGDRRR